MADHTDKISKDFHEHSVGDVAGHVAKHILVMGAMMGIIALAAPVAAASVVSVAAVEPVTLGNLLVQSGHGTWEMLGMIGDTLTGLIDIGGLLWENTMDGNWAPTTWDSMIMGHDMGGAHDVANHVTGHHGEEMMFSSIEQVAFSPMDWFDTLPLSDQMQMREDAALFGVPFDEYVADLCATEHPHL
ncbi:MAG: hypothetical protein ACRBDI_05710 [Alphaproteobacteria bacterium]